MTFKINDQLVTALCACMLFLACAGCATNSYNSTGEWQQPRTRDVPFQTVLVIAIVPDSDARRVFEQTVAEAITDGGATGIAAYSLSRQRASQLTREMVVTMAENVGADSVLVARVLGRDLQAGKDPDETIVHAGPVTTVVQNEDASFTRALTTDYAVEVLPGSMVIEADAVLETSLYEPATGDKLVYWASTRGHFEIGAHYPVMAVAHRFALSLARQLRSDQVIR